MGSFGKQTSELQTQQFPGLFGSEQGAGIGQQLQDILLVKIQFTKVQDHHLLN